MSRSRGFSLIEVLVVMATVAILMAISIPLFQQALLRANTSSLSTDARALYLAIKQYYVDNNTYPPTAAFELDSFDPLYSMGYYTRPGGSRLVDGQADGYFGDSQEFWLEMTLRTTPAIRFLIADSDDAPLSGGVYRDGVFLYLDGVLSEIGQVR